MKKIILVPVMDNGSLVQAALMALQITKKAAKDLIVFPVKAATDKTNEILQTTLPTEIIYPYKEQPILMTPPITRKERRKAERKANKKCK